MRTKEENKAFYKDYYKDYYSRNEEAIKAYRRKHYQKNKDKSLRNSKKYWQKNKKELNKWQRDYYQRNKDKMNKKNKEYQRNNKDKINAYQRELYKKNKLKKTGGYMVINTRTKDGIEVSIEVTKFEPYYILAKFYKSPYGYVSIHCYWTLYQEKQGLLGNKYIKGKIVSIFLEIPKEDYHKAYNILDEDLKIKIIIFRDKRAEKLRQKLIMDKGMIKPKENADTVKGLKEFNKVKAEDRQKQYDIQEAQEGYEKEMERYLKKQEQDEPIKKPLSKQYVKHRERILAKSKKYYAANKEKIAARKKRYYAENKGNIQAKKKNYYEKNKEKSKMSYIENKEEIKKSHNKYYLDNREKKIEYGKEYYVNNKEKIKEYKIKYNAKKKKIEAHKAYQREYYQKNKKLKKPTPPVETNKPKNTFKNILLNIKNKIRGVNHNEK